MGQSFRIIIISDMDATGSGYASITTALGSRLANLGHEVKIIGLSYNGEEHHYKFSLFPCGGLNDAYNMLYQMKSKFNPDVVIGLSDIPNQEPLCKMAKEFQIPYICITPMENGPLCASWATILTQSDKCYVMSEFAVKECKDMGVEAEHLTIGVDTESWRPPTPEERLKLRESYGIKDEFVILTVADNQERKNLWGALASLEIFKQKYQKPFKYWLVTRENQYVGYRLRDLASKCDVLKELTIFERGLPFKVFWGLYAAADVFLLTSKAEGLCNLPGSKIWTINGLKNIEDVRIGEMIISKDGNWHTVSKTMVHNNDTTINEITMGFGLPKLKLTDNHPVLGAKKFIPKMINCEYVKKEDIKIEWISSQNIDKMDYVFFPELPTYDIVNIPTAEILTWSGEGDFSIDGNEVVPIGKNQFGSMFIHPRGKRLPLDLEITPDLMRLIGWFIAEGCDVGGLQFSLNSNELEYQNEIKILLKTLFNLTMKDKFLDRNRYSGNVYHTLLGKLFASFCGHEAHNKVIPNWALYLPEEKLWPMVESMFRGDGCIDKMAGTLRYSTVSEKLATQLQFVLLRLGVVSTVRSCRNRCEYIVTVHRPEIYKVPFVTGIKYVKKTQRQFIKVDGGWLFPVRENRRVFYRGPVYNLEVPVEQSYLMGGGIVHNCMPVLEAMSTGLPVVSTRTGAAIEHLSDGRGYLVTPEYTFIDTWGNSRRDMIDRVKCASVLQMVAEGGLTHHADLARKYVLNRTWDKSVKQLLKGIKDVAKHQ